MIARCYMEYCCNEATEEVARANRSGDASQPAIPWGWCSQHFHHAFSQRKAVSK